MITRVRLAALLVVSLIVMASAPGRTRARGDEVAASQARYDAAKEALGQKQYAKALTGFRALIAQPGLAEDLAWGALVGAGLAAEGQTHKREALLYYQQFLLASGTADLRGRSAWLERHKGLSRYVRELEVGVLEERGRVSIESTPSGARMSIDGQPAGPYGDAAVTPTTVYLLPGIHDLVLELPGHERMKIEVRAILGDRRDLHLPLTRSVPKPPPPVAPIVTTPPPEPTRAPVVTTSPVAPASENTGGGPTALWGWVGLGASAALLTGGVICTVLAAQDKEAAEGLPYQEDSLEAWAAFKRLDDRRARRETTALALYGVGGAALAGSAAYLLLFSDLAPWPLLSADHEGAAWRPRLTLSPWRGGLGAHVRWSW